MVNQICIAGLVQGPVTRRIALRQKAGLDVEAGDRRDLARALRNPGRWTTAARPMVEGKFDFGFAVDWMRKDLGHRALTRRAATARTCRSPRWSISSTARCRRWAANAGTPREFDQAVALRAAEPAHQHHFWVRCRSLVAG